MSSQFMAYNSAAGLQGMLKDGTRHFSNEDDPYAASVVLKNIDAVLQLTRMLQTSLGPQGRCKLVVNHLERHIVTSDCAEILKHICIEHPAAQLVSMACQKQQDECGDNTHYVAGLCGALLFETALLIGKMTWQPASEILAGIQRGLHLIEHVYLPRLVCQTWSLNHKKDNNNNNNTTNKEAMLTLLRPVLASKQYGSEGFLAHLVADACLHVMNHEDHQVIAGNVRTVKILGAVNVRASSIVYGYVAQRSVETTVSSITDAHIAVYACGFEASSTEAKGTVVMHNADDLLNYNTSEERKLEEIVASIASAGVQVVVTGGNLSDMALHFLNRYGLMCLKVGSKWELRRLCVAIHATALVRLGPPTLEEMGRAASVSVREIAGKTVTVFENHNNRQSKLATIVLRASTLSVLNDLERAVDDGVQAVSQACKDIQHKGTEQGPGAQMVYGGGATEMALSALLQQEAAQVPGLDQYGTAALGAALQFLPRVLAENAGWDATRVLSNLQAVHHKHVQATASMKESNHHSTTPTASLICDEGVDIERLIESDDDTMTEGCDRALLTMESSRSKSKSKPSSSKSSDQSGTARMHDRKVLDLLSTKLSAIKLAVDAAITILKIDQIIMSKPSGGPKM